MINCIHWREYDHGEHCKAKGCGCTCSGVLSQCDYLAYFNIPADKIEAQRARDRVEDTVADVEPFVKS